MIEDGLSYLQNSKEHLKEEFKIDVGNLPKVKGTTISTRRYGKI